MMTEPLVVPYYRPPKPDLTKLRGLTQEIAKSYMISNGPVCRELEETVRDYHGVRYALSCSSCTVGLHLALRAAKALLNATLCTIPSFTWASTRFAAESAGLNVAYGDVNLDNWLMAPVKGDAQTVIMPVTTFGASVNTSQYQGNVLVDAAHAVGTPLDVSGALGAVLSFAPSKLITTGEGGMLLTDNTSMATSFTELRDKFGRMSEFNAAMGLAQWDGLDAYIRDRRNRWLKYCGVLSTPQKVSATNYSTAAFRVRNQSALIECLKAKGIETRVYYEPLKAGLPVADRLYKEIVCLPTWYGCQTEVVLKAVQECRNLLINGKQM